MKNKQNDVVLRPCPVCGNNWVVFPLPQCLVCDHADIESDAEAAQS